MVTGSRPFIASLPCTLLGVPASRRDLLLHQYPNNLRDRHTCSCINTPTTSETDIHTHGHGAASSPSPSPTSSSLSSFHAHLHPTFLNKHTHGAHTHTQTLSPHASVPRFHVSAVNSAPVLLWQPRIRLLSIVVRNMMRTGAHLSGVVGTGSLLRPWQNPRACMTQLQLPKQHQEVLQLQQGMQHCRQSPRKCIIRASVLESSSPSVPSLKAETSLLKNLPLAVSIIIPIYNEVGTVSTLVEQVGSVMQERGGPYEVICVDDGSTDGTTTLLKSMAAKRHDMRVVLFRRNFGQTAAMAAGFNHAAGELLVTLDGDLQNDPQDIPRLLDHLIRGNQGGGRPLETGVAREDGGFDLVCGWRRNRKDNFFTKSFPSWVANMLIGALTGVKLHDYGCSLKAYRASLLPSIRLFGEMHRFIPALAAMEGAAISEIEVRHHPRRQGKSKYGLGRIFRVLMDLTTIVFFQRFRDKPMHVIGFLGGLCILGSMVAAVFTTWSFTKTAQLWGYEMAIASARLGFVLSLHLLIMGFQLVCLGLLAEVCVRTYFECQPRPVYRIREIVVSARR